MRKRTVILAVLVFLALAGGLAAYLLVGQDSEPTAEEPTAEEAKQEPTANPETTAEAEQLTTAEGTDGEETTQDTNSAAQYAEGTVEETDPIDETNLAEASPQEVVALYYNYLNGQAWEEAYGLLSSQSQQRVSLEQWVAGWQARPSYTITEYSISPVAVQSDLATLQVDAAIALGGLRVPASSTRQMVREDGVWRVVLSDREVGTYAG